MARRNKDEEDVLILTLDLEIGIKGYIVVPESHPYYNSFLSKAGKTVSLPVKITEPNQEREQVALKLTEVK